MYSKYVLHHLQTCRFSSPCGIVVVADFLLVDIDDVLHQQVSLQAVDAVAIQHHFMSAGRTPETTAVHQHGGASLEQGGLHRKIHNNKKCYMLNINITDGFSAVLFSISVTSPQLPFNTQQVEFVGI